MAKKQDQDVLALKRCVRALNKSTSRRVLSATIRYLLDRYVERPSDKNMPEHLKAGKP